MRSARVFCLPSFFEGLPLVVLEAVASGCRVVVNDLPGLTGWLRPDWLASGRITLVEMPAMLGADVPAPAALPAYRERLREALSEALAAPALEAPRGVEDYTWAGTFQRLSALYAELSRA